jgi:hypothetical protein
MLKSWLLQAAAAVVIHGITLVQVVAQAVR